MHLWPKLGEIPFTALYSQGFRVIACCDLDLWPSELISKFQDQVHSWPNFDQNSSIIYKDIVFTRAVTLTFNLWFQKLISTFSNVNTSVTEIG